MDFRQAATRTRASQVPAKAGPGLSARQGNRVPLGDISGNHKTALETRRPLKAQVKQSLQFESPYHVIYFPALPSKPYSRCNLLRCRVYRPKFRLLQIGF